jgi:putative membrane protein
LQSPKEIQVIQWLPHINVSLNAIATILLIVGYVLIKQRREHAHRRVMLATLGVNVIFLVSYLVYHYNAGSKPFPRDPNVASDLVRYFYLGLLASHVVLAAAVPVLAIWTIYLGLKNKRESHRKLAKWTWPIWLYVSVTGVIVYLMLYQLFVPPAVVS